jgi:hypothetical protein
MSYLNNENGKGAILSPNRNDGQAKAVAGSRALNRCRQ